MHPPCDVISKPMNFSAVDRLACSREARLTSNYPQLFFKLKEPATLRLPFVPPLLDTNFVGTSLARLVCMHTERSLSGLTLGSSLAAGGNGVNTLNPRT